MAKVRELLANRELSQWCGRRKVPRSAQAKPPSSVKEKKRGKEEPGEYLQGRVPALYGPEASKPWVETLRRLLYPPDLVT